jgi:hypothetical protein
LRTEIVGNIYREEKTKKKNIHNNSGLYPIGSVNIKNTNKRYDMRHEKKSVLFFI